MDDGTHYHAACPPGKKGRGRGVRGRAPRAQAGAVDTSQKTFKIRRETWFLTSTAQGDFLVFYAEGDDIIKSFQDWVLSDDPFEKWVKAEMKGISGVDPDVPSDAPLPKQLLRYGY
jgi:hypothetical protein